MKDLMVSSVISDFQGVLIEIEVALERGFPSFSIVGLPDAIVNESKLRIRSAIEYAGFKFPKKRIVVNLMPANLKKHGSHLDLPIAISILQADGHLGNHKPETIGLLGELGLSSTVRQISYFIPLIVAFKNAGIKQVVIPLDNCDEAQLVEGITVFPVKNLMDVLTLLKKPSDGKSIRCTGVSNSLSKQVSSVDISHVDGQEQTKRALLLSASGGHHVIMMGGPGTGKSLLAKSLINIMPPLTDEELLSVNVVHSLSGGIQFKPLVYRPFRAVSNAASRAVLIGGTSPFKFGEMALAHHGILFLDELLEFKRDVLESLRVPMEIGQVQLSKLNGSLELPSRFIAVASFNPCPCGYYGDAMHPCSCTPYRIRQYQQKLSAPLLDRFDLQCILSSVPFETAATNRQNTTSETFKCDVLKARDIQKLRYKTSKKLNAHMDHTDLKRWCVLNNSNQTILEHAYRDYRLSVRGMHQILRVARTIADLDNKDSILEDHLLEALCYRSISNQVVNRC